MITRTLVLAVLAGAFSSTALADSTTYELTPDSEYATGCFPPCLCPLTVSSSMTGTFELKATAPDPLFQHFNVVNMSLVGLVGETEISIVGSGTYSFGGRVALQQRMELDLSIDGARPKHFDSGWTSIDVQFPSIDVVTSINGMFCVDTVVHVAAKPAPPSPYDLDGDGKVGAGDLAILLGAWGPCPQGGCSQGDFDVDGKVDASDLSILLGAWS